MHEILEASARGRCLKYFRSIARPYGLRLHLLSGDRQEVVSRFARDYRFDEAVGGATPSMKEERIRALQLEGRVVAFAGDGVNDAPALATADAVISLPGLEATAASAPLNLRREGLLALGQAHRLARRLHNNIRQNLAWAFGYNLVLFRWLPLDCWSGSADP